jgi:hypothetical protein
MTGTRVAISFGIAIIFLIALFAVAPRGFEAGSLLSSQDDPVALADKQLERGFTAEVARREIEAALAADDADLAQSFLDLARDQKVTVDPALAQRVEDANSAASQAARGAGSFARGLVTGEPDDLAGLAGTTLGDFFVFGDVRDAVREGTRLASGQQADELVLGLAAVGRAITAGTYVTLGASAPLRIGLTVAKAARKTSRLSAGMADYIGRTLRGMVDWGALQRAISGATVSEPLVAIRAARAAVKMDKGDNLVRLMSDVGRVQSRAGTQAALDGLKLAEGPRDMARVARLAEAKGSKTRAILKFAGRSAIFLSLSAFNLAWWVLGAIFTLFGFVSSLKSTTERVTLRRLQKRKLRKLQALTKQGRMATYARA